MCTPFYPSFCSWLLPFFPVASGPVSGAFRLTVNGMAFVSTSLVKQCATDDACQFERTAGGHLGVGCGYGRFGCNHRQQRRRRFECGVSVDRHGVEDHLRSKVYLDFLYSRALMAVTGVRYLSSL